MEEVEKTKEVNIGFTRVFIDQKMMECFHVVQADVKNLMDKGPMLVIETNDGLESIKSPVTGTVRYFNPKARNFPDRLTEEDIIITVLPKGIVVAGAEKVLAKKVKTLAQTALDFPGWANNPEFLQILNNAQNRNVPEGE